jgi:type VI secretion system protein ImpL
VASPPPGGAQAAPTPGAQTEAAQAEGGVAVLTEERQAAQLLLTEGEPGEGRRRRHTLLKDTKEVERATARLKYLCRLIGRRRQPYCPINGILLVVPLAATDTDEDADQTGAVCRHDLTAVREAVQVHCPVLALVSDLENLPGFDDLVHYFPDAAQRERFLGRQFPLVPHLEPADVPGMLAGGIHWLCLTLFPTVVYKLYRLETPGREETEDVVRGNARLFQFLGQLRQRAPHLSRLLTRAVAGQPRGLLLFGGCYLAATGPDTAHGQAFVSGVFRQLVEYQNYVSWTADALDDEAGYRWLTRLGYLGIVVLFAALLTLVVLIWPH